jgi:exopolyphosphatase/guanosine-5'-triphosphate,3'-diphosphate pyrophosphatase
LLHDIGNHISYEKHHRHSYYLIKNGDLRGFEPEEIAIIALLTRYHRRAVPQKDHEGMGELSKEQRRVVTILSAFLRLAETFDRSRHGVIRGLEIRERLGELRVRVQAVGDAELEVWAAHRQARALEEALARKVRIEKVPYRKGLKTVNSELSKMTTVTEFPSRNLARRRTA